MTTRLYVRLDAEQRRKLDELAQSRGISISALVREMIDRAYEEWLKSERLLTVKRLGALAVEDVPDPETLNRQLDETYEFPLS